MAEARPALDLDARIAAMREKADVFVTQRRRDVELYEVLAECLSLCEDADSPETVDRLADDVIQRAKSSGRRCYFEKRKRDVYIVVGRLIFEGEKARADCWRYTSLMREAHKKQIRSPFLVEFLRENGGINALFKARRVNARSAKTKTLNLNQQIEIQKSSPFTVTLIRDHRGFFDVLKCEVTV